MENFIEKIQNAVQQNGGKIAIDIYLPLSQYFKTLYNCKDDCIINIKLFTMIGVDGEIVNNQGNVFQKLSINYEDISFGLLELIFQRIQMFTLKKKI